MFHRFLAAAAIVAVSLVASPAKAELLTFNIDPSSAASVNTKVYLGAGQIADATVASTFVGTIVLDVTRDGGGDIVSAVFDSSTRFGLSAVSFDVDLGSLGVVPTTLDGFLAATAVDSGGGVLVNDSSIAMSGGNPSSGNALGQSLITVAGTAILGPATGPIGDVIDPVTHTTTVNLANTSDLQSSPFTLTVGPTSIDLSFSPSVFLDNIVTESTFALTADVTISGTITASAATVPEVGTMTLMGCAAGLMGAGILVRRRKGA